MNVTGRFRVQIDVPGSGLTFPSTTYVYRTRDLTSSPGPSITDTPHELIREGVETTGSCNQSNTVELLRVRWEKSNPELRSVFFYFHRIIVISGNSSRKIHDPWDEIRNIRSKVK